MAALSASRAIKAKKLGDTQTFLAANSKTFYHGGMVMLNTSGLLEPAAAAANRGVIGVCELDSKEHPDGSVASGTGGTTRISVREGLFSFAATTIANTDIGNLVWAEDDQTLDENGLINEPAAGILVERVGNSEGYVYLSWKRTVQPIYGAFSWSILLATLADGDIVTTFTPGFAGYVTHLEAHVTKAATTAAKLSSLNVEVGTTNVTGTLALTSANMTPLGAVVSQALTGTSFFSATDTLSIEAASTTAFIEGSIEIVLRYKQLSV